MNHKLHCLLTALLGAALLVCGCGSGTGSPAKEAGKVFHYGTMAYGPAMQNASTDPHDTYCGWSTVRYGVGETLFKFDKECPALAGRVLYAGRRPYTETQAAG